jgi:pimeloyl-ACP methyl ester carboxylesterase
MLDPRRMWYVIAALAVVVLGVHWGRNATRQVSTEPVAIVAGREGAEGATETLTRGQCLALPNRLWIALEDGAECIAYIAPDGAAGSRTAVLFFDGDVPEEDMASARTDKAVALYQRLVTEAQRVYGLPVVVVARPGLMGSSGMHLIGGMRDEGITMNAAVDALKELHGYARVALAGQSGGARIVAQLLVLGRRDIVCAAMASGAYGVPRTKRGGQIRTNIFGDPGRKFLVPLHHAEEIASSPDRRAFVIGDPRDVRTPFSGQREWAERVQALGHHAVLLEGAASDPEHHGLSGAALRVAALCATGKTDQEIAAQVAADRLLKR